MLGVVFDVDRVDDRHQGTRPTGPPSLTGVLRLVNVRTNLDPSPENSPESTLDADMRLDAEQNAGTGQPLDAASELPTGPAAALRPRLLDARLWIRPASAEWKPTLPEAVRLSSKLELTSRSAKSHMSFRILGIPLSLCSAALDAGDCGFGIVPWRRDAYRLEQDMER